MRERDLSGLQAVSLMLDGVALCQGLRCVVAIGIERNGTKSVLGFAAGSSENAEVCRELVSDPRRRGLRPASGGGFLAVLDGSEALKGALLEICPGSIERHPQSEKAHRQGLPLEAGDRAGAALDRQRAAPGGEDLPPDRRPQGSRQARRGPREARARRKRRGRGVGALPRTPLLIAGGARGTNKENERGGGGGGFCLSIRIKPF